MCIVCKMREAGASEEALELAAALADFAVTVANGLARLKTEEGAFAALAATVLNCRKE